VKLGNLGYLVLGALPNTYILCVDIYIFGGGCEMKRLCFVVLLFLAVMASGAFAVTNNFTNGSGDGLWSTADNWSGGIPVDTGSTSDYVKVQTTMDCILNSDAGNFGYNKITIAGTTATLEIQAGGNIGIGNEFQDSDAGKTGYVIQTGGTVSTFQGNTAGKIEIGYKANGVGYWTISGGSIGFSGSTNVGQILVGGAGAAGSIGTFTIIGNAATINTDKLWVGAKDTSGGYPGTGTLEFQIGAGGVSPINVNNAYLDPAGDSSTAALVLSLIAAPPSGAITLVSGAVTGTFDTFTDSLGSHVASEGALVTLSYGATNYLYTLTYSGSVELVPEPATLALLGLGSLIAVRRRRSK
jgi:hypothetical protein